MTKEEIIELARQADFLDYELDDGTTDAFDKRYETFAKLVARHEREACAKICEEPYQGSPKGIAEQIRARGEQE
jgi:hypothetical protein